MLYGCEYLRHSGSGANADSHVARLGTGDSRAEERAEGGHGDDAPCVEIIRGLRGGSAEGSWADAHNDNTPVSVSRRSEERNRESLTWRRYQQRHKGD